MLTSSNSVVTMRRILCPFTDRETETHREAGMLEKLAYILSDPKALALFTMQLTLPWAVFMCTGNNALTLGMKC